MATSDEDRLLQRELHWKSRPGDRRRPAGSNAITAIGIVLTLVMWAVSGLALAALLGGPSGSGVIDPKSLVALAVFGAEMFVAAILATRIWIGIGPGARQALRPFAFLGPFPMLIMAAFAALYIVSIVLAPFTSFVARTPPAPVQASGRNWRLVDTGRDGVTYEEALERCQQTGERVPTRDDVAAFDPPYAGGTSVWVERPADGINLFSLSADGTFTQMVPRPGGHVWRHRVVCFRP